jgi:hypothetical protein
VKLIRFQDYLSKRADGKSTAPPATIRAKDLDDNFQKCQLAPDKFGVYKVETDPSNGSSLVFMADNRQATWRLIDVCDNGEAKKMWVLGTEPFTP